MTNQKPIIAVIGKGVIGLTCAEIFLEHGFRVHIFSKDDHPTTASMGAGAYWWPHKAYPANRVEKWAKVSLSKYRTLSADKNTGVNMHRHNRICSIDDETTYALNLVDQWTNFDAASLGIKSLNSYSVEVPLIDVSIYMPWLEQKVAEMGAVFHIKDLNSLRELSSDYPVIINCTGLGAKSLANDKEVFPIRGQIVKLERPENLTTSFRHVTSTSSLTLILPRINDCVLGGTSLENNYSTEVDDNITQEIIERCSQIVPELRNSKILGTNAALRPGRKSVRLESEEIDGRIVIHNYGHGGSGYTISYGCAEEVFELATNALS
jgi:D-amino-acid oxidase